MTRSIRILALGGALTLPLSATAAAATVRLIPSTGITVAPSLSCGVPAVPAALTNVYEPVVPPIAEAQHAAGVTNLRIELDKAGHLARADVITTSGNRWLDEAAIASARLSRYRSETRNCESIAGTYVLAVDFDAPGVR